MNCLSFCFFVIFCFCWHWCGCDDSEPQRFSFRMVLPWHSLKFFSRSFEQLAVRRNNCSGVDCNKILEPPTNSILYTHNGSNLKKQNTSGNSQTIKTQNNKTGTTTSNKIRDGTKPASSPDLSEDELAVTDTYNDTRAPLELKSLLRIPGVHVRRLINNTEWIRKELLNRGEVQFDMAQQEPEGTLWHVHAVPDNLPSTLMVIVTECMRCKNNGTWDFPCQQCLHPVKGGVCACPSSSKETLCHVDWKCSCRPGLGGPDCQSCSLPFWLKGPGCTLVKWWVFPVKIQLVGVVLLIVVCMVKIYLRAPRPKSRRHRIRNKDYSLTSIDVFSTLSTALSSPAASIAPPVATPNIKSLFQSSSFSTYPSITESNSANENTHVESHEIGSDGQMWHISSSLLGEGGCGKVYMGLSPQGSLVAVKVIPINPSESSINDHKEVAMLSKLNHPNIVRYICSINRINSICIVMEYVAGGSLQQLLTKFHNLSENTVKGYMRDVIQGLEYLHAQNIVHRDLKPGNVLLDPRDGRCKISDFGCSRYVAVRQTTGITGTVVYMAPETIKQVLTCSSDMWSLGVMMVQLMTGTLPFGDDLTNMAAFVFQLGQLTFNISIPPQLSPLCRDCISRCLIINPNERSSASELLRHPFMSS